MPLPIRQLPVLQNWDCQGCSDCCRTYSVRVSEVERERIASQKWADDPDMAGVEGVVWDKQTKGYRLNHSADGKCVFLGPDNRCRIHAKFGAAAKPMACRIYPFVLVPTGSHWQVGIRFGCPTATADLGRPLPDHAKELTVYAGLLEANTPGDVRSAEPPKFSGQSLTWPDLLRVVRIFDQRMADTHTPVELRWRQILQFATFCSTARFATLSGGRLSEFLEIMTNAANDETPTDPATIEPPGWIGRSIFRQVAAIYSRKDNGPDAGIARRSRFARIWAAWRFALGSGAVPKLHGRIPDVTFSDAEKPSGPLSADIDALLTRYYRVKISSMQFCGPANFGSGFWEGLYSLALTFPVILWLARVLSGPARTGPIPLDTMQTAVRIVDDNFGFNVLLGSARQQWAIQTIAKRGELTRLIAWYGR